MQSGRKEGRTQTGMEIELNKSNSIRNNNESKQRGSRHAAEVSDQKYLFRRRLHQASFPALVLVSTAVSIADSETLFWGSNGRGASNRRGRRWRNKSELTVMIVGILQRPVAVNIPCIVSIIHSPSKLISPSRIGL